MSSDRNTEESDPTLQYLKKIPAFEGLTLSEIQKIFNACRLQQYGGEEVIYRNGAPSADMFILLDGTLSVRAPDGLELSQIIPVGLVGEMGVLTGEPRSADVVAIDNVMGLLLHKEDLTEVCVQNADVCRKMLTNIIRVLSRKLHDANVRMVNLKRSIPEVSEEVENILSGNVFLY